MRQTLYLLSISVLLPSCATMLNSKQTSVKIISNEPISLIINEDTVINNSTEKKISVNRSKEPLIATIYKDNLTKTIKIKPRNSFAYWLNIYPNWHLWTGFLFDKNKAKRYTYPKRVYLDMTDTNRQYYTYLPWRRKGNIDFHLSIPHINIFLLNPENESSKSSIGFWGLTFGLDYYHSKNQFINASISGVSDFFFPIPAAVTIIGEYELMSSIFTTLSNNHRLGHFTFGYGLSYARNIWDYQYYDNFDPPPATREPIKRSHHSIGLVFPAYYQIGEIFHIGIVYRPSFFRPNLTKYIEYEHVISIDFAWKFGLFKT
ncbi:MAG: hypothetical protein JJU02_15020 [Cryomorphaceae bacterium]|nr:hypothetical protein [Cryomorphaceae bacterium]